MKSGFIRRKENNAGRDFGGFGWAECSKRMMGGIGDRLIWTHFWI